MTGRRLVWFGCWDCGCSMLADTDTTIADRCPQHGRPLIADNAGLMRQQITSDFPLGLLPPLTETELAALYERAEVRS